MKKQEKSAYGRTTTHFDQIEKMARRANVSLRTGSRDGRRSECIYTRPTSDSVRDLWENDTLKYN